MKASSGLFLVLLVFWIGGSTYWYVCKHKHHCDRNNVVATETSGNSSPSEADSSKQRTGNLTPEQPAKADLKTEKPKTEEEKTEIAEEIKKKIESGYAVSAFPKNETERGKIEEAFYAFADDLKRFFEKNPDARIQLTGHTDNTGTPEKNLEVGKKRALFIKEKLVGKGIAAEQIDIDSKGETIPVASNETEIGRKQNRRVNIQLIKN